MPVLAPPLRHFPPPGVCADKLPMAPMAVVHRKIQSFPTPCALPYRTMASLHYSLLYWFAPIKSLCLIFHFCILFVHAFSGKSLTSDQVRHGALLHGASRPACPRLVSFFPCFLGRTHDLGKTSISKLRCLGANSPRSPIDLPSIAQCCPVLPSVA